MTRPGVASRGARVRAIPQLKPAQWREAEMEPAGVGGGVIVLERDVGADDGEIAKRAAEGRSF
jgi:hypothetical protein